MDDGAEGDPEYHEPDLHAACAQGDVKRVQVLLDQGADVNKYWHVSLELGKGNGATLQASSSKRKLCAGVWTTETLVGIYGHQVGRSRFGALRGHAGCTPLPVLLKVNTLRRSYAG